MYENSSDYAAYNVVLGSRLKGHSLESWSWSDKLALAVCLLGSTLFGALVWRGGIDSSLAILLGAVAMFVLWVVFLMRAPQGYARSYQMQIEYLRSCRSRTWFDSSKKRRRKMPIDLTLEYATVTDLLKRQRHIALNHSPELGVDYLYIRARGGVFSDRNGAQQQSLMKDMVGVFNRVLNMSSLRAGIAVLGLNAPADFYSFQSYMRQRGDPMIFRPELFELSEKDAAITKWMQENFDQIIPTFREYGASDSWGLIVLTIRRESEWQAVKKGKATNDQVYRLPVLELGRSLVEGLNAADHLGFSDVHILDGPELFRLNRISWDVYGAEGFYEKYNKVVADHSRDGVDTVMNELQSQLSCWPERLIQSQYKDAIQMDDNWAMVLRVTALPEKQRADVTLALRRSIGISGGWVRTFDGGERVSVTTETNQLYIKEAAFRNISSLFTDSLTIMPPSIRKKQESMANETELASDRTMAQRYVKYVMVIGESYPLVQTQAKEVLASLKDAGYDGVLVNVRSLHLDAVLTAGLGALHM